MNIEEKFHRGAETHTYQRIDGAYQSNIYLGYNEDGKMSMVITEFGSAEKVSPSELIDTKMTRREDGRMALSFDLADTSYASMFEIFCKDIIVECEKVNKEKILSSAIKRWKYWKELFGKKKSSFLTKDEVKGLIGELIELRDFIIPKYGKQKAITAWMGPLLGHKDFEVENTWFEVKSVKENASQVSISSLEQLESEMSGYLVVFRLEDSNSSVFNATNLNKMVLSIVNILEEPEDLSKFREKLDCIGYAVDPMYDNYCFLMKERKVYQVNNDFPRIRRKELNKSIGNASYTIILDGLRDYMGD